MDNKTVTLISEDSELSTIESSFGAVRTALGGALLEPVTLPTGDVLLVDEEGVLRRLPYNVTASLLSGRSLVGKVAYVPKKLVKKVLG
jgi:hypothetical protein